MRVLVVDDNPDAATSLSMLLRIQGHEVFSAHDGAGGLRAAEAHRPDVVLLDIGLPGMTGYEVARRIRNEPWGRSMRLVALSGWGQEESRQRSLEVGFDVHLTKPADPSDIERVVSGAPDKTN
jgi:CheY-like chemotaxis protein